MATLGKLLLLVNILIAAGVVYLATESWSKHQEDSGNAVRHFLVLRGLPVDTPKNIKPESDEVAIDLKISGNTTVDVISKKVYDAHFQGSNGGSLLGGPAPLTRVAELQRAKTVFTAHVRGLNASQKIALLCGSFDRTGVRFTPGVLTQLALTFNERNYYRDLVVADPNQLAKNAETALNLLVNKIDGAIAPPDRAKAEAALARINQAVAQLQTASTALNTSLTNMDGWVKLMKRYTEEKNSAEWNKAYEQYQANVRDSQVNSAAVASATQNYQQALFDSSSTPARDDTERVDRIADILVHLDPSAAWQKRVALVVGLQDYLRVFQQRISLLPDLAQQMLRQREIEIVQFIERYEQLKRAAINSDILLSKQKDIRASLELQVKKDEDLYKTRKGQYDRMALDYSTIQGTVSTYVSTLDALQEELFKIQKKVGETMDENFRKETELESLSRLKLGQR